MKLYEFIVNTIAIVGGGALIAVPNGLVGLALFAVASVFTDSLMAAALVTGIGGIVWAQVLFGVILPLPFRPFSFPRMPLVKMLGWYVAFGVGYGVGPLAAAFINQSSFFGWPVLINLLCSGGLPLVLVGILQPLGIVGFPNRKFD
jgi:hypothetical protein